MVPLYGPCQQRNSIKVSEFLPEEAIGARFSEDTKIGGAPLPNCWVLVLGRTWCCSLFMYRLLLRSEEGCFHVLALFGSEYDLKDDMHWCSLYL